MNIDRLLGVYRVLQEYKKKLQEIATEKNYFSDIIYTFSNIRTFFREFLKKEKYPNIKYGLITYSFNDISIIL